MSYEFLMDSPCENCTSLPVPEGVYSAECFSDIPASVLSRLNLTAEKSCSNDSETESCQDSQSGMTLKRSTDGRGEERLMWFAGDSPVRTYLPPTKESESAGNDLDCGPSSLGSLAKFNPDLYGWKTAQCSLFGGLEWYAETWPRWGMICDGELFPLRTPEPLTCERESGYLPTPRQEDSQSCGAHNGKPDTLTAWTKRWPTPCLPGNGGGARQSQTQENVGQLLSPTTTRNQEREQSNGGGDGATSPKQSRNSPAQPAGTTRTDHPRELGGGVIQKDTLGRVVNLDNPSGGQLNPTWVEWLMGWPIGWTDLKPLETAKFQVWCASHGIRFQDKNENKS